MLEPPPPDDDGERRLPPEEAAALPLQFQVIRVKQLPSRESFSATTIANAALRSSHSARGCIKPISKIVDPRDDE